jgi:hypothetical protein
MMTHTQTQIEIMIISGNMMDERGIIVRFFSFTIESIDKNWIS